jgi:hypothetical protein
MSATTLVSPEPKEAPEQLKDAEHSLPRNGHASSQSTQSVLSASELENWNEVELKAAIKSAWKMHEHVMKKDMAPLLFWLRLKLRAQGSRNDIHDKDRGFGAWVEENLDITRRTADRWADKYALDNGLGERKPTSRQPSISDEDKLYEDELGKHSKNIQFNCLVSQKVHKQYEQALKTIKMHFKITKDKEAVVKGVCYAAETISARSRVGKRQRTTRAGR